MHSACPSHCRYVPTGQSWQVAKDVAPIVVLYVPARQFLHSVHPSVSWYVPAGHDVQLCCPVVLLYVPVGHGVQLDCPVVLLYVPVGHGVQAALLPMVFLYVPGGHGAQLPFSSVYPTSHKQDVHPDAQLAVEPGGHGMQGASPATSLYMSVQAVGVPPSGPVYPRTATQSVTSVEPVLEVQELGGHGVHPSAPVSPDASPHVPAGQAAQRWRIPNPRHGSRVRLGVGLN